MLILKYFVLRQPLYKCGIECTRQSQPASYQDTKITKYLELYVPQSMPGGVTLLELPSGRL